MANLIDLNCDLGERATTSDCYLDAEIMPFIQRCNICCGAHAGSIAVTEATMLLAKQHHLKIGAHPGFADPKNFGRKVITQPFELTLASIKAQLNQFLLLANQHQVQLAHVKLHGALYNLVESDPKLALQYLFLICQLIEKPTILGLAGGALQQVIAADYPQVHFIAEGFIDRTYQVNGQLMPRQHTDAVLNDIEQIKHQAAQIAQHQQVTANDGSLIPIRAESLCIHGDRTNAIAIADSVSQVITKINRHASE